MNQGSPTLLLLLISIVSAPVFSLPAPQPHPRLLAGQHAFDRLQKAVQTDPVLEAWYKNLRADGDRFLKNPPYKYELRDGVRLLMVSRDVLKLVTTEALLYKIGGDPKDLARAWAELDHAARFPDWHPAHFLDVAELAAAVALGYDWLAADLTSDQKAELRTALVTKALEPAAPFLEKKNGWAAVTNNWNFVCNGGISLAALAIADEDPSWAERLLPRVLESLPHALAGYAPDGAWNESPGYWDYGTSYLVELVSSLQLSYGSDFGLLKTPGLNRTGDFALALSGPGPYQFGYGDVGGPRGWVTSPALWYLAKTYGKPAYGWARKTAVGTHPLPLDLLWYDPALAGQTPAEAGMTTDQQFKRVEVATFRGSWTDPEALFVGIKGTAFPDRNHTDLDNGSFFLGVFGSVWATDLGSDNYNLPGYFDMNSKHPANRWNLYRKRAEGHNTLVINPGTGPDQDPGAQAPLVLFKPGTDTAATIVDLTRAYPGARDIRRGLKVFDGKTKALVQDEIHLKAPGDIWWFLHLDKGIAVKIADDGKSAILSRPQHPEIVAVVLVGGPPNLRFTEAPATPLPTSPQVTQNPNDGYQKLVLHVAHTKDVVWGVELLPEKTGVPELPPGEGLVDLKNW